MLSQNPKDGLAALEKELQGERASALGRIGGTLERLISEAQALAQALPVEPADRARTLERHEVLRKEAETWLWYLIVTREAMGLRRHEDVYAAYALPRRLER